jgi:Xaa-Pro aminopeptidase
MSSVATITPRADRAAEALAAAGADALLVSDLINLRYLTGFVGTNGLAVIAPEWRTFATDFRYVSQAAEQVDPAFERQELPRDLVSAVEGLVPPGQLRLGFESSLPFRIYERLRSALPDRIELVPVDGLIEAMRAVKEPHEAERMQAAAALADAALGEVLGNGLIGRTEQEVALELEFEMRRLGAERPSFEPVVAAGAHGALPHASPRAVTIERGQMVVIDWGAQLDGYCSDCTRTIAAGPVGAREQEIYALVLEAQLAGLDATRAGTACADVDAAGRDVIAAAGHGEHFGHGVGHGVGLDIHEEPRLTQTSESTLEAGNAVTIEPGVYLPGDFGVRIEDLVIVTTDGREILTSMSKELTVV